MKRITAIMILLLCVGLYAQEPTEGKDWTLRYQAQIRAKTPQGNFHSAIYYTPEEWKGQTVEAVDKAVADRIQAWIDVVTHPPVPVPPTKADLLERVTQLQRDLDAAIDQVLAASPTKTDTDAIKAALAATAEKVK